MGACFVVEVFLGLFSKSHHLTYKNTFDFENFCFPKIFKASKKVLSQNCMKQRFSYFSIKLVCSRFIATNNKCMFFYCALEVFFF